MCLQGAKQETLLGQRRNPLPASLESRDHPDSHSCFGSPSAPFPPLPSSVIADNTDFNIFTLAELFAFRSNYEARHRLLRRVVEWGENMPILLGGGGVYGKCGPGWAELCTPAFQTSMSGLGQHPLPNSELELNLITLFIPGWGEVQVMVERGPGQ